MRHENWSIFFWRNSPQWAIAASFTTFLDDTRRTTVSRNPLHKWSARRRGIYLTTLNIHKRHSCSRWDSNPQFQQASSCRPTSWTARPLGPAVKWFRISKWRPTPSQRHFFLLRKWSRLKRDIYLKNVGENCDNMQLTSKPIEPNSQQYFSNTAPHWRPGNTFVMKRDFQCFFVTFTSLIEAKLYMEKRNLKRYEMMSSLKFRYLV